VPPLHPGFGLSIGVTSYDGGVYYGISADRDALPDIDVLGQCVTEALDELVDSASSTRPRARRGAARRTSEPGD
jgi:diacylglycerol O-acyltransferase